MWSPDPPFFLASALSSAVGTGWLTYLYEPLALPNCCLNREFRFCRRVLRCGVAPGVWCERAALDGLGKRQQGSEAHTNPTRRLSNETQHHVDQVASLLSILFLTLHITDDIVRGISKAESSNTALLVLVVFLYGTLVLPERRSGHVIMLLIGLFAAAMPVMHMRGAHYGEIARSPGGFFFVWTLWALGGLGGFTLILSARGLWDLRRGRPQ